MVFVSPPSPLPLNYFAVLMACCCGRRCKNIYCKNPTHAHSVQRGIFKYPLSKNIKSTSICCFIVIVLCGCCCCCCCSITQFYVHLDDNEMTTTMTLQCTVRRVLCVCDCHLCAHFVVLFLHGVRLFVCVVDFFLLPVCHRIWTMPNRTTQKQMNNAKRI